MKDAWKQYSIQDITSAKTSMNVSKMPKLFTLVDEKIGWNKKTVNVDIGGGKFNNVTKWLRKKGVKNLVFDPYNRTQKHNESVIQAVHGGRADTVTVSNVLNVIKNPTDRSMPIFEAFDAVKRFGMVYFTVYEGNRAGHGNKTTKGWQCNRKINSYLREIRHFFGDVKRVGRLIIARDPRRNYA